MNKWPRQSQCKEFYGNPSSADFEGGNIVNVSVPWMMVTAWDGRQQVKNLRVHHKCAQSLGRILAVIWSAAGKSQDVINEWGLNKYGGGYVFRPMRGGRSLSMHAFGCAVDFDPERNPLGGQYPHFAECHIVLTAFEAEGWTWGGSWQRRDGMHFQAASIG